MFKNLLFKILKTNNSKQVDKVSQSLNRFFKDIMVPNLPMILFAIFFMAIFAASNAALAWIIKPIINNIFVAQDQNSIWKIGIEVIGISFVKSVSQYLYTIILFAVSVKVMMVARKNLYSSFIHQDISFHNKNSAGKLVSVAMNELNALNNVATDIPINVGRDLFTFLGLLGLMFYQNAIYASFIVGSIFIIVIPVKIIGKKVRGSFGRTNKGLGELTSQLEQTLNGIREVKSYNKEKREMEKTDEIIVSLAKTQRKINRLSSILPPMMEIFGGISIGAVLIYAGYQVVHHNADPGTFFSFVAALLIAYQPLKRLTEFTVKIQMGALAINRYYSFLDASPLVKEADNAKDLIVKKGNIDFKNITFFYTDIKNSNKSIKAVDNISFSIKAGERIALVGRSGGGKSTILNLIERFYDPDSGQILIDKQDIKDVTIKSLRDSIALVSQDVTLFNDTVFANVSYSKDYATQEEVERACINAYCLDFINKMPQKFDTIIGPRGAILSGGQRQRISIARAILKNSPILLLDEATSALDTESEQAIQAALSTLMKDKTTIIIAHRLSTIINCDQIFVIDQGQIIEKGTHEELLNNDISFYKYLYDLQFKEQENKT